MNNTKIFLLFLLLIINFVSVITKPKEAETPPQFWQKLNSPEAEYIAFGLDIKGNIYAGTEEGDLFFSSDHGQSWSGSLAGTFQGERVSAVAVDNDGRIFAGVANLYGPKNGIYRSTDGGKNWGYMFVRFSVNTISINSKGHIAVATQGGGLFISESNGNMWRNSSHEKDVNTAYYDKNDILYMANFEGHFFKSTDNGLNWTEPGPEFKFNQPSSIYKDDTGVIYLGTHSGIFASDNEGISWKCITADWDRNTVVYSNGVAVESTNQIFAARIEHGIFASLDSKHWFDLNDGLNEVTKGVKSLFIHPANGHLYAGTAIGVYKSLKPISSGFDFQGEYHSLIDLYLRTAEYEKALKLADLFVQKSPLDIRHYYLRANIYAASGNYSLAIADAKKIVDIDMKQKTARYDEAYYTLLSGLTDSAFAMYNGVFDKYKNDSTSEAKLMYTAYREDTVGFTASKILSEIFKIEVQIGVRLPSFELKKRKFYTVFDEALQKPRAVHQLDVQWRCWTEIPNSISNLTSLQILYLSNNSVSVFPEALCRLPNLEHLYIENNNISSIPDCISNMKNLVRLSAKGNKIEELPESIGDLDTLKYLDLRNNNLKKLPESIGKLKNLYSIDLQNNPELEFIPESIKNCTNLKIVYVKKGTKLSEAETAKLKQLLPAAYIN